MFIILLLVFKKKLSYRRENSASAMHFIVFILSETKVLGLCLMLMIWVSLHSNSRGWPPKNICIMQRWTECTIEFKVI